MSKKYSLIINIAMIVIGIIGMLLYFVADKRATSKPQQTQQVQQPIEEESISVAVAKRELAGGTVLSTGDFIMETRKIPKGSSDKENYSLNTQANGINGWMVKNDISAGSTIPVKEILEPGTPDYIKMSVKPGQIVYGFSIKKADSYLFTNLKAGGGIDIYLSYKLVTSKTDDGQVNTKGSLETSQTFIGNRRFKLLLKNKKILSLQTLKKGGVASKLVSDDNPLANEGYMLVELSPDEVRILKGLDGGKFYIFPTTDGVAENYLRPEDSVLIGAEGQWPIDNRKILTNEIQSVPVDKPEEKKVVEVPVKEYRGAEGK